MVSETHEPHIVCPKCSHLIPLTESIAAPLLEVERKNFQQKLAAREAEFERKAGDLRRQQDDLSKARENIEEQVRQRLAAERTQVAATEAKKAREEVAGDLAAVRQQLAENEQLLKVREAKLAEAQQVQAEALRKQRDFEEKTRELEVTIETRVQASQSELVTKAKQAAADELKAQISQKDTQIESLGRTVEELKRKLEQGSQQTQGEAFELELESLLRGRFPLDLIEPVAKGETGGDIVQTINARAGAPAGVILWELKNTKTWSDTWLPKLRDNKRAAKADVALIVSTALPKGVETFDLIDGVYVAHARCAVPVALTLRQGLLEVANARTAQQGQQSKAEQAYNYLTGSRFKQRIEAVVERFKEMRDDIDKERKFMMKAWAKREAQVTAMVDSTVGMVGDLHGIMGQAMPEISAIEDPPMIEGKAA
ncbi:DUF2130 domain-containing protein [Bradyrhizobium sp. JYMT SZCCT0428]|uniref:DUF2130 domain-containing protein n=1 Tax=Bradyrhizobium sp. JYMT SZCCT0428 TaxID=2807673 RepID=UPI001BAADB45|nr:DUF2130 domain-containing protein [Bradyrhizobium sp. JYMT SZCCT0428]MBR1153966.1 DUF2130 domain-containing protein [Bradyrhizobium sp. JYMT SZCCT0428]